METFRITLHLEVCITAKDRDTALFKFIDDIPLDLSPHIKVEED